MTDEVRWKRPTVERSWRYGTLVSLVGDYVEISDKRNMGRHTIARKFVEIKRFGPRNGVRWEKL